MIDESDDNTKRRLQCPTAPKVLDLAEPRDARFVMAGLVSSGTTRGERPFVPRSALIASDLAGQVTGIGCPGSKSPSTKRQGTARGQCDVSADLTTRQGIPKNRRNFASRCPNHGRPSDCVSSRPLPTTTSGELRKLRFDAAKALARSAANAESEWRT
jgi:hypothetical protein